MATRMFPEDESERGVSHSLRNESMRRRPSVGPTMDVRQHFRRQLDGDVEDPCPPGAGLMPTDSIRRRLSLFEGFSSPPIRPQWRDKPFSLSQHGRLSSKPAAKPRDWRVRLLIYLVYLAACLAGGRLIMQYATPEMELCQQCTGSCGKLAHGYMIPQKDMGGLPFGSVLGAGTPAYCVDSFCVPKAVRDPWGLCTAVQQDSTLLHGMKRRLMSAEDEEEADSDSTLSKGAKWANYFSRRKLSSLANSPLGAITTPPLPVQTPPQQAGYNFPVTTNPSLLEDLDPSNAGCTFIAYNGNAGSGGYVNTTDQPYMAVGGAKTIGQCCHLCAADSACTHYTATSSDASSGSYNCYMKNVNSPAATEMVGMPVTTLPQFPYVRYADPSIPGVTQSGAKPSTGIPATVFGQPMP